MSTTRKATAQPLEAPLHPLLNTLNQLHSWAAIRTVASAQPSERSARTLIGAVAGTHAALIADISTAVRGATDEALSLIIAPTDRQAEDLAAALRSYLPADLHMFASPYPIGHLWSLNVEEHSYIFLSLLTLLPFLRGREGGALIACAFITIAIHLGGRAIPDEPGSLRA